MYYGLLSFDKNKEDIMKHVVAGLIILVSLFSAGSALAQNSEKEKAALAAAQAWLSKVDAGEYEQSWTDAAGFFRNAVGQDSWVQSLTGIRTPMGQLTSRTVIGTTYKSSLPGAPDGEYVIIQFQSAFTHKQSAVETVTPMLDQDGQWRVSGYYIK